MKVECKEKREEDPCGDFMAVFFFYHHHLKSTLIEFALQQTHQRERAEDKMSLNSPSLAKSSTVSIAVTHQQPQIHPELSLVALNWLRWKNLTTHYMLETTYISSVLDTGKYTTADAAPMSVTRWRSCRGMAYCSRAQRALPAPRDPQILKLALMLPISNTGVSYSEWPESCKHQKLQDLLTTANWDILTPTQWAV